MILFALSFWELLLAAPAAAAAAAPAAHPGAQLASDAWLGVLVHAGGRVGCSGGVLAARWLATAAHCLLVCPERVRTRTGDARALGCYRHRGAHSAVNRRGGVTELRHDIGLVSALDDLVPGEPPPVWLRDPLPGSDELAEISGLVDKKASVWTPFALTARVVPCANAGWQHAVCARRLAPTPGPAPGRRLCYGDSGNPATLRGALYAVLSMGPLDCGPRGPLEYGAVFTPLHRYRDEILATVNGSGGTPAMRPVAAMTPVAAETPLASPARRLDPPMLVCYVPYVLYIMLM